MNWLIVGEPRAVALDAQGPYLTYAYVVCYGVIAISCFLMTFLFWLRRGNIIDMIPRRELWVFFLFIASLGLRYMSVVVTLYVGIYWLDVFVLALSAAFAAAAAWVVAVRLIVAKAARNG